MEKRIKDFEDYAITDDGKVISYKFKEPRILKTWFQKNGYENIKLSKNNQTYHKLIHRLVAEAFIPNPDNLPEVNHKDKNVKNNKIENLEWCTREENLKQSYETMSSVRNFHNCILINFMTKEEVGKFQSITEAARYSAEHFGTSYSGMVRNYSSGLYQVIKIEDVETKQEES